MPNTMVPEQDRVLRSTTTTIRLYPWQFEALDLIAQRDGNRAATTIRNAVSVYIDQRSESDGVDYAATARAPRAAAVPTGA